MRTRESGASMTVGWFLVALAVGAWLPRKGAGLYQIIASSEWPDLWRAFILLSGAFLVVGSFGAHPRMRALANILGIVCWLGLAFAFVSAQLWGAAMQACVAICVLNHCLFQIWRREH